MKMDDRVNRIIRHPLFIRELKACRDWEQERIFCRHDMDHLLSVARYAWIYVLENSLDIPIGLVYGAALLHDIGRAAEYAGGPSHDTGSCRLAADILSACGYNEAEQEMILTAIKSHRRPQTGTPGDLTAILYRADKKSRDCFACRAEGECNWDVKQKNMDITR